MGEESKIQWTDHTFNPWEGCTKVSAGCLHCYAEKRNARFGGGTSPNWGKGAPRKRTSIANWNLPYAWNNNAITDNAGRNPNRLAARRPRVFCASLADWLDEEVPIKWLADLLVVVFKTRHLTWQLLTKRPENFLSRIAEAIDVLAVEDHTQDVIACLKLWVAGRAFPNIWVGTSIETTATGVLRWQELCKIASPVHFISCEPMLEAIDLQKICERTWAPDWIICGGESGANAREFCVEYAWELMLQASAMGCAFFMKQLGSNPVTQNANAMDWPDDTVFIDHGEAAASAKVELKDKKGGDMSEWPRELQLREFAA